MACLVLSVCLSVCLPRVESYSCKMAGSEKKLYKQLSHQHSDGSSSLQALSPPQTLMVGSPVCGSPTFSPTNNSTSTQMVFVRSVSGGSGPSEPQGPQLRETIGNKTLFYLKSTLNLSFQPDYDFTDSKSEEFSHEPNIKWVMDAVRSNLTAAVGDSFIHFEPQLWAAIDEEIHLSDCAIYRCVVCMHGVACVAV